MLPFYQTHSAAIQFGKGQGMHFPMHMHKEVELIYVKEGENTVSFSGIEHTLSAGEIAIAFPNEPHAYHSASQELHIDFIFDPELCPDFSAVFRHYRPEYPHLNVNDAAPDLKVILDLLYAGAESGTQPDVKLLKGYL